MGGRHGRREHTLLRGASLEPDQLSLKHCSSLIKGLSGLRNAEKLLDVTLIVEGRPFKAHRVVLAACSDYFNAMFTDAMRESTQSEITLNGLTAGGFELLIDYIYTARLELNMNNVEDVLSAATHVQVRGVIDACVLYLESLIDLDNCVAIATLADLFALNVVKRKSYIFLCSHLNEFSRLPDFLQLTWQQLEHILASNYPVDCTELHMLQIITQYCLKTKLESQFVQRLLSRLRLHEIPRAALRDALAQELPEQQHTLQAIYKKLLQEEAHKQLKNLSLRPQKEEEEQPLCTDVLNNTRGMELALVKIGGFETDGLTNQLSTYLPSKGKWEDLTVIPHIEQCNYGTAVLGNHLYIVGGSYDVCLNEYIHPFGFRYDPTKDIWKPIRPIQADRCRFSLNAMGSNFLYAVGGVCEDDPPSNCERYSADSDTWEYMTPLSENRSQHAGVTVEDKLYISGGINRLIVYDTLWCFDSKTQGWKKMESMQTPRSDHVMIAFDDKIYVCGGWYEDPDTELRSLAETIEVYNIRTNHWTLESRNPVPRFYTAIAALKRRIYFIGGLFSDSTLNRASLSAQYYDIDTKEWKFDKDWDYPKELWESTCVTFFVPCNRSASEDSVINSYQTGINGNN